MTTATMIIIVLLSVLILLAIYSVFLLSNKNKTREGDSTDVLKERLQSRQLEIEKLQNDSQSIHSDFQQVTEKNSLLRESVSRLETQLAEERSQNQEKIQLLENAREKMSLEFKNLANEILEQKGRAFTDSNRQNIESILKPLQEKIQQFEKKVDDTYDRESKERFSLAKEIRNLQDLNLRISEDAVNLTNALKGDTKTQGNWGEFVLERLLENSGLRKGSEYVIQKSLRTNEGGNRQPDVIIHLPESKDVIVDSKVSLVAYERYYSEPDESKKNTALKEHIQSIRNHIRDLSKKDYQNLQAVRSLDFVIMFLPVESAFALAVQNDQSLFTEAFDKNIALVAPTTLMATLRTIQNIWRYEHQNKNALEIAKGAGAMYDKFVSFTEDLEDIGKRLDQTQVSYEQAHKKLVSGRGNLVTRVEKLKTLGARASKSLAGADTEESLKHDVPGINNQVSSDENAD